jgi:hypothetical protein
VLFGARSGISSAMSSPYAPESRLEELRSEVASLREKLAPGAPIIPLASVRARDRAEATSGAVLPFGLASSLLFDEQFGEYTAMDKPRLYVFEGTLMSRHIPSLLPLFEEVARERAPIVLAASDVDEDVLAMVALNKRRGSLRGAIIVPAARAHASPLILLERMTGAGMGAATDAELRIGSPAAAPRLLATLHETAVIGARQLPTDLPSLGLLHMGGEDMAEARARARAAREMLARWRMS